MRRPWSLRLVRAFLVGLLLCDVWWAVGDGAGWRTSANHAVLTALWLGWVPPLDELWGWKGGR